MKTKKSLGQHFLKSKTALVSIINAGDISSLDNVLEIGPGEGVLTEELLKLSKKVTAVEKDQRLIPILQEKFDKEIKEGKFDLIEKDILEFDERTIEPHDHKYKVIANIPYYITGQIIRKFLESRNQPEKMVILVQKEVAERIVAKDGKESLLSLSVKAFGEPEYIKTVPKGAFSPSPKVDSAILSIKNISRDKIEDNEKLFFKILHAGFAHKRKQLLPNLTILYKKEMLVEIFKKLELDLKARAEDLSFETWVKLCNIIAL